MGCLRIAVWALYFMFCPAFVVAMAGVGNQRMDTMLMLHATFFMMFSFDRITREGDKHGK